MPILIILRHGKAEQESPSGRDGERPLAAQGQAQAVFIGERLAAERLGPARILHSTLMRAQQTAEQVAAATDSSMQRLPALEFGPERAETEKLLDIVAGQLEAESPLLLIGHNPQLERLCLLLHYGDNNAKQRVDFRLRTGEAYVFEITDPERIVASARLIDQLRLEEEVD